MPTNEIFQNQYRNFEFFNFLQNLDGFLQEFNGILIEIYKEHLAYEIRGLAGARAAFGRPRAMTGNKHLGDARRRYSWGGRRLHLMGQNPYEIRAHQRRP